MKALILAGGYGTRIRPCSYYLNKHMWPVYNRPLIEYAVEKLIWAGITDIGIVLGGAHPKQIEKYLGDGARYGASFTCIWQGAPRGISEGVNCARDFCGNDKFIVHLADNIVEDDIECVIKEFGNNYECLVLLKQVEDPRRFGVAEYEMSGKLVSVEEKPKEPKSNLALVGIYGFNDHFFEVFETLKPSWRGEYEITEIISAYIKEERKILTLLLTEQWFSCDTFDSLLEATAYMQKKFKLRKQRN